jgi:tRNA threonylcarbamoyladenosine biosynthesis protein TsaB
MFVLAFDTAQQACSAAISRDGEIISQCHKLIERGHAEQLLPMVETVRKQADVNYEALDLIAVTIGPGTFTGVRVGLAAARALALVQDIPVLGVGTLELLAQMAVRSGLLQTGAGQGIIAAIDARRGELYSQAFDAAGRPVTAAGVGPAGPEIAPSGLRPGVIVGTGAALLQADLPAWRLDSGIVQPDAAVLALASEDWRDRASRQPPAPLYLRAPDARLPGIAPDAAGRKGP